VAKGKGAKVVAEYQSLLEQCEQHIVERNKLSEALQKIAMLADTGSGEYRKEFGTKVVSGWRVAERMREIALEVVGLGRCEWCGGEGLT